MYDDKNLNDIFKETKAFKRVHQDNLLVNKLVEPTQHVKPVSQKKDLDEYYVSHHQKIPTFHFKPDEQFMDFFELPEYYLEEGREYANKYPRYTKTEEIRSRWQTEEGTPNEFNRLMRSEATGASVEAMRTEDNQFQDDEHYWNGLKELKGLDDFIKEETDKRKIEIQTVPNRKVRPIKILKAVEPPVLPIKAIEKGNTHNLSPQKYKRLRQTEKALSEYEFKGGNDPRVRKLKTAESIRKYIDKLPAK